MAEKVPESKKLKGRQVEIVCKDLPCSCRGQYLSLSLGRNGAFICNCSPELTLRAVPLRKKENKNP